jgi:hypothetical protein
LGKEFCHISRVALIDVSLKRKPIAKKTARLGAKQKKQGKQSKDVQDDKVPTKNNR